MFKFLQKNKDKDKAPVVNKNEYEIEPSPKLQRAIFNNENDKIHKYAKKVSVNKPEDRTQRLVLLEAINICSCDLYKIAVSVTMSILCQATCTCTCTVFMPIPPDLDPGYPG